MLNLRNRVSQSIRILALLALLLAGPAAIAADPNPDPSWIDIIQSWFETLLDDDPAPEDEDGGVIHLPGG